MTLGGVIAPGQPLMDIVPVDDELTVETRINPIDTDTVHEGLPAEVRMTAFKRSISPPIKGKVFYVSPDQLADPKTGEPYFIARIHFDREFAGAMEGWTADARHAVRGHHRHRQAAGRRLHDRADHRPDARAFRED